MKLKAIDGINIASILLAVAGIVLEVVGGAVFSVPVSVGMNTNLSPLMFVGIALMAAALAAAIVGSALTEKKGMNKVISAIALYLAVLALMFAVVFLVLTIVMPVLNPTNG